MILVPRGLADSGVRIDLVLLVAHGPGLFGRLDSHLLPKPPLVTGPVPDRIPIIPQGRNFCVPVFAAQFFCVSSVCCRAPRARTAMTVDRRGRVTGSGPEEALFRGTFGN